MLGKCSGVEGQAGLEKGAHPCCMLELSKGKGLANQKCQRSHRGAEPPSVYVRIGGVLSGPWIPNRSVDGIQQVSRLGLENLQLYFHSRLTAH